MRSGASVVARIERSTGADVPALRRGARPGRMRRPPLSTLHSSPCRQNIQAGGCCRCIGDNTAGRSDFTQIWANQWRTPPGAEQQRLKLVALLQSNGLVLSRLAKIAAASSSRDRIFGCSRPLMVTCDHEELSTIISFLGRNYKTEN